MKIIVLSWLVTMVLAGCVSTQRAVYLLEKRKQLASICSTKYPIHDSTVFHVYRRIDTVYFVSDSIRFRDTVICNRDTIILYRSTVCPPAKTIIQTITKDSIIYKENTAKVESLQVQLDEEKTKREDTQKSLQTWRKLTFVFGIFILIIILFTLNSFLK